MRCYQSRGLGPGSMGRGGSLAAKNDAAGAVAPSRTGALPSCCATDAPTAITAAPPRTTARSALIWSLFKEPILSF